MPKNQRRILIALIIASLTATIINFYLGYLVWTTGAYLDAFIVYFILQTVNSWSMRIAISYTKYWFSHKDEMRKHHAFS